MAVYGTTPPTLKVFTTTTASTGRAGSGASGVVGHRPSLGDAAPAACEVAKLFEIRLFAAGILQRPLMRATANKAVAYQTCAHDSEGRVN
jgi:hypothetical protein